MKQTFRPVNLRVESRLLVNQCNDIIADYLSQGLRLTLRQLYYQLVTKNVIPNVEKSYKKLSGLVSDARLSGLMDWDAIEDRVRRPRSNSEWDDIVDLVDSALASYRLPRWEGQEHYVELWVEKDALAGVLAPMASRYHVTMMVNRGYSSQSAMYEAADRFIRACYPGMSIEDVEGPSENPRDFESDEGAYIPGDMAKQPILLYLGDHDPSGEDMVRDIQSRLEMFGLKDMQVIKIALTMDQVKKFNPPPNPAKRTDPRAHDYMAKHGAVSWEVDALPPNVLTKIIQVSIEEFVDLDMMQKIKDQEEVDKGRLRKAAEKLVRKKK